MDEGKNAYVYFLYQKRTNMNTSTTKSLASDDWMIDDGKWYVEVRVDHDEDDPDNGEILESNENNNDAQPSRSTWRSLHSAVDF